MNVAVRPSCMTVPPFPNLPKGGNARGKEVGQIFTIALNILEPGMRTRPV